MMKNNQLPLTKVLFAARLSLVLLIGATIMEIVLIITANMGAVWNSELRRFTLESVFLILVFLSVGTMIVSIISKKIIKPFHDLQGAIHEVSKGNFNVSVQYTQNDEFAEVVKCFNQMVVELNGIQTIRDDFINTFSHECKTPISSIRGFAKQLKRTDISGEEREEYLDIIISESDRLLHLYQNILSLCRYRNQEFLTNLEVFSLDEQIRRCILLLEKECGKKEIDLDIQLQPIDFYGNVETMSQVWINLLSNAIKFSHPGGVIRIQCEAQRKRVVVKVKDYGIGMDESTMQHMFDKFFSSDLKENQGNGLGLPIVKRIIELYRGEIEVTSELGLGTEVEIRLPRIPYESGEGK